MPLVRKRIKITAEEISAAVASIRGDGKRPTLRAVRERLGRGSMNTLVRTMREHRMRADVDWLSNVIRSVDGRHQLGAGALAERIVDAIYAGSASNTDSSLLDVSSRTGGMHGGQEDRVELDANDLAARNKLLRAYVRDLEDTLRQLSEMLGTPKGDADRMLAEARKRLALQEPDAASPGASL